jgi:hypothetical protein
MISHSDENEWIEWIGNEITENHINYHEYDEFKNIQGIGFGTFGDVYRATWESLDTFVALKSFIISDHNAMKRIANEVGNYTVFT